MPSFTQFTGLAVVVLSLGYFANALPMIGLLGGAPLSCNGSDAYSLAISKILIDCEACIKAIIACGTLVDLKVQVALLINILTGCSDDLLKIGAGVVVAAEAKAQIVTCIAGLITLIVRACLAVSLKFGLNVCIEIFAGVDIAIKGLLVNLDICIAGIVGLIAKSIVSVTVGLLAQVQLKLCLGVLGLGL
ncbi:hypothetical protein RHS03_08531, partial [Rhizoctonia solani]